MSAAAIRKLLSQRDFASAIDASTRAIQEAPVDAELHFLRALALAQTGRLIEAEASLRSAIALEQDAPWTWELALINILRDRGAPELAREASEALLRRQPDRP